MRKVVVKLNGLCDTYTILRLAAIVIPMEERKGAPRSENQPTIGLTKIGNFLRLSQLTLSAGVFTVIVTWKSLVRVGVDDS